MAITIPTVLNDRSRSAIELELLDSNGVPAGAEVISFITYTWSHTDGTEINSRKDFLVPSANPVRIILEEADLIVASDEYRLLTITWIYTDSVLGVGTKKVVEYRAKIDNAVN